MNLKLVFSFLGILIVFLGILMVPAILLANANENPAVRDGFLYSAIGAIALGLALKFGLRGRGNPAGKDAFGIVVFGWILSGIVCAAPFVLSGQTGIVDGLFESISGLTTTGATIFEKVHEQEMSILLWRSITQWIGGMGIVLVVAVILSFMESTDMAVLRAEVSVLSQKMKPRLWQTGLVLAQIYVGFTAVELILLLIGGLDFFDALCHSLTTMATGGFSTRTESIGGFQSFYVECVTFVFMIMAATSFFLHYRFLKGDLLAYWRSTEFKVLVAIVVVFGVLLAVSAMAYGGQNDPEAAIRQGLFQSASFTTTTGYTSVDHTAWPDLAQFLLLLLMFVGGCVGSTGGSLKIRRWIIIMQALMREMRKVIHPNRVIVIRVDGEPVEEPLVRKSFTLFMLWILAFVAGGVTLILMNVDPKTAFTAAASSLGNVGPALGSAGSHMAGMPAAGKLLLASMMLLGRLEIFIMIVMFSPALWRRVHVTP